MQEKKIVTSKEIGIKIKKRRIKLGITQEQLAETLDVTYQQVQRYENGSNRLNVENIQLIAGVLSLPVSHFFESDEKVMIVREEASPYLPAQESKLMRYFGKIGSNRSRSLVIQVAQLAAKTTEKE
ncbi:MAG: helix-turn-helix transcriptional regulator [Deltaproteobacteria bacterium]|nr:helix-turn-helix transcriptional regulator [Deltaproteobacteria bacterium]